MPTISSRLPLFVVVRLPEPTMRRGVLCVWGCQNTHTGRIWKQTYRVTREAAERQARDLILQAQFAATIGGVCQHWNQPATRRH